MAIELNERALKHAEELIEQGHYVSDDRDAWSVDEPSADDENVYLDERGWDEYSLWYLGINTDKSEDTKGRYKFPYGDFENVHRGGVISAESRAGQYKHFDVERAAARLRGLIDAATEASAKK